MKFEKSKTVIEIINADGKVLQNVFSGRLDEGKHSQKVQLADVADSVFFYRITGKQGTSVLRSLKVN